VWVRVRCTGYRRRERFARGFWREKLAIELRSRGRGLGITEADCLSSA
jgi:hypothetical protein